MRDGLRTSFQKRQIPMDTFGTTISSGLYLQLDSSQGIFEDFQKLQFQIISDLIKFCFRRNFCSYYTNVFIAVAAATLWLATISFVTDCERSCGQENEIENVDALFQTKIRQHANNKHKVTENWRYMRNNFIALKHLANHLNSGMGHLVSVQIIVNLLFYSTYLNKFFSAKDSLLDSIPSLIWFLLYLSIMLATFIISADIPYRVRDLYFCINFIATTSHTLCIQHVYDIDLHYKYSILKTI